LANLTAQFIAVMVVISQTPMLCIALGVMAYGFGVMEAGMVFRFANLE
jgi:hypothetical protein